MDQQPVTEVGAAREVPPAQPLAPRHRAVPALSYRREWLLLALGAVLAGVVLGYQHHLAHDAIRVAEEARLATQARTVADNMQRQLQGVTRVLASLRTEFPLSGQEPLSSLNDRLQLYSDMSGVRTLSLFDAQGNMLASNRPELVGRNFRDRTYFTSLPARPDTDVLYVSAPFTTALGVYSINLSRAVLGASGELAGLVSATLDPAYFEVVSRSVLYADDMTVSFVHGEGTLFYSQPSLPKAVGRNLKQPGAIFTQHMASGQISTVVSAKLLVSGSDRMIANHNLQPAELRMDQPLVIGVARDLSGIYQGWHWQTLLYALSFLALTSAAGGLLGMSQRGRAARAAEAAAREHEREQRAQGERNELTARLQATRVDLRGTREHLALAADAVRFGLWVRNVATNEVWVSDAWRKLLGFDPTEPVTNDRFVQRVHADDRDVIDAARASIAQRGRYQAEYRIVLPDSSVRWIASHGRMEHDEQGRPAVFRAVSMDITERKLAALALQQQQREVTHLSRVVMLGELSGALAHELNQPLAAILSNAQAALRFMAREPIDLGEVGDALAEIVNEDRRASEVIVRLRRLLTTGETQFGRLDMDELLTDTLKLLRTDLIDQKVTLRIDLAPALPQVWADRVQLQQVLINLLMNAVGAMHDVHAAERQLLVRLVRLDNLSVQVSVVDRGCGLPDGQADRLFESFYSTKPGGMGLGLSVCRTIIQAHGGRIWAENNPGAGAIVHFTVRVCENPPQ